VQLKNPNLPPEYRMYVFGLRSHVVNAFKCTCSHMASCICSHTLQKNLSSTSHFSERREPGDEPPGDEEDPLARAPPSIQATVYKQRDELDAQFDVPLRSGHWVSEQ
jgi:hypothetical protein